MSVKFSTSSSTALRATVEYLQLECFLPSRHHQLALTQQSVTRFNIFSSCYAAVPLEICKWSLSDGCSMPCAAGTSNPKHDDVRSQSPK